MLTVPDPSLIQRYLDDGARDELAAALLVARLLGSTAEEAAVRQQLLELQSRFVATIPDGVTPATLVRFFGNEGFVGADGSQIVEASCIDWVLSTRRGIPISLSVPYVMLGRGLGLDVQGVNFPGHFLVRAEETLIDPLNAQVLERADVERWLADANLSHRGASALAPASPDAIAVRMLNNVKAAFAARGDFVGALGLIDSQMKLVDDVGPLHLERAELWFRLGNSTAAIAVLEEARPLLAGTGWEGEIDKRLQRLATQPRSTIH